MNNSIVGQPTPGILFSKFIGITGEFEVFVKEVLVHSKKNGDGDCSKTTVDSIAAKVKAAMKWNLIKKKMC